jgi:hypothetical protein
VKRRVYPDIPADWYAIYGEIEELYANLATPIKEEEEKQLRIAWVANTTMVSMYGTDISHAHKKAWFTNEVDLLFKDSPRSTQTLSMYVALFVKQMTAMKESINIASKYGMLGDSAPSGGHSERGSKKEDPPRHYDKSRDPSKSGHDNGRDTGKGGGRGGGKGGGRGGGKGGKGGRGSENPKPPYDKTNWLLVPDSERCKFCGKKTAWHHGSECPHKNEGKANREDVPWSKSTQGNYFLQKHKQNFLTLKPASKLKHLCSICNTDETLVQHCKEQSRRPILTISLLSPQGRTRSVTALLDSGATRDYVSLNVAKWLEANGSNKKDNNKKLIGSGFKNVCTSCTSSIDIEAHLENSVLLEADKLVKVRSSALIIDASIDLVIGLVSLRSNNLILHYPHLFFSKEGQHLVKMLNQFDRQKESDSVLSLTDGDQVGGPVSPLLTLNAFKSAKGVRASAILPLRNNYDLQVDHELVPIKYGIHRVEDELEVLAATGDINTKISAPGNNYSTRTEWGREDISEIRTDQLESIESEYLAPKKGDDSDFELPT